MINAWLRNHHENCRKIKCFLWLKIGVEFVSFDHCNFYIKCFHVILMSFKYQFILCTKCTIFFIGIYTICSNKFTKQNKCNLDFTTVKVINCTIHHKISFGFSPSLNSIIELPLSLVNS